MSDTPITDAATFNVPCHGSDGTGSRVAVVHYHVCYDLERQLAEVTKQRDELAARIGWEAALATLKGDKP